MEAVINNYKEILGIFKADCEKPEWILKPFVIDDNVYSTDKYCMVWFDKSLVEDVTDYGVVDKSKVINIIPQDLHLDKVITLDILKEAVSKCPQVDAFDWVGKDVECKECKGEGDVEWEYKGYTKEMSCPVCEGDGLSSRRRQRANGKKIADKDSKIKVFKSYFSGAIIQQLIQVTELVGENEVTVLSQAEEKTATLFKIGNVSLIAMPFVNDFGKVENVYYTIK